MNGIYFQDKEMKRMYDCFPELLFIDATYKLNNLRMPLYVFLIEDGNGESEIVATWMVVTEDKVSISQMAKIFKNHNPNWGKTKTIMSDKDFIERDALKSQFPDASILICLFHVLRTFRREITCEKLGITSAERGLALEIVQKMAYAKTSCEYLELYQDLKDAKLPGVVDYFDTNWHSIKEQWVDGLKNDNVVFLNRTNNRIECINQKLKSVILKYSSLPQFFSQLVVTLQSLRTERDHRALTIFQKVPITPFKPGSPEHRYMNLVTPYALDFIVRQLELAKKVKIQPHGESDVYSITSSEGNIRTIVNECSCSFNKSMQLRWPGIDHDIENMVKACTACQQVKQAPAVAPLHPWIWPSRPWQRVHVDFAGPFLGSTYLIAVDAHSKWPEAQEMKSTTAAKTIEVLRHLFARFGLPEQLVSDNGPQFVAEEFAECSLSSIFKWTCREVC